MQSVHMHCISLCIYLPTNLSIYLHIYIYSLGHTVWNKIEKSSKTGQENKILTPAVAHFLNGTSKVSFLEKRLSARMCITPNLKVF